MSPSFTAARRAAIILCLPLLALFLGVPNLAHASTEEMPLVRAAGGQLNVHLQQLRPTSYNQLVAYMSVTDADGHPVAGLAANQVSVVVDAQPTTLQDLTEVTDVSEPLTAAVLLDTSYTMGQDDKLPAAKAAIKAFGASLNAQDQVAFYQIAGTGPAGVHRLLNFTTDHAMLNTVIDPLQAGAPGTRAPIYDALYQAAQDMASIQGRKLIVLQTDQHDDGSTHTLDQALGLLEQVHQPVYTIGLGSDADLTTLQDIAQATGGIAFANPDSASLTASYQSILSQFRDSYRLTVQIAKPLAVGEHAVQVQVQYQSQDYTDSSRFRLAATNMTLHLSLSAGSQVSGQTTVTLKTEGDDLPVRSVEVTLDGRSIAVTSNNGSYQFNLGTRFLWPGTHQLRVVVADVEGNQAVLSQPIQVSLDWAFWLTLLAGLVILVVALVALRFASYRFLGVQMEGTLTVRNAADQVAQVVLGEEVKGRRLRLKITEEGITIGAFPPGRKIRFSGVAKPISASVKPTKEGRTVLGQLSVVSERVNAGESRVPVQYFRQAGKGSQAIELIDGLSKKVGNYRIGFAE